MKKAFYYYTFPEWEENVVWMYVSHYLGRQALNINTDKILSGPSEKNKQDKTEAITANSHRIIEWPGLEGTLKSYNSTAKSRDTFH